MTVLCLRSELFPFNCLIGKRSLGIWRISCIRIWIVNEKSRTFYNMEQKFFICDHCGKIIAVVKESGVPVMCCGQKMKEIIPGTTDAAIEKHVPVYTVENNIVKVKIGEVEHPMLSEHYIE